MVYSSREPFFHRHIVLDKIIYSYKILNLYDTYIKFIWLLLWLKMYFQNINFRCDILNRNYFIHFQFNMRKYCHNLERCKNKSHMINNIRHDVFGFKLYSYTETSFSLHNSAFKHFFFLLHFLLNMNFPYTKYSKYL